MTDTQEPTKQSLEIAHVLFMDIVAYSTLHMDHQQQVLHNLQEAVRNTSAFKRARANDQLIRLPTGDGMALVFFRDPEAPVRCALELTKSLRSSPDIKLRMGIHTGPVYRIADINANRNVAGGGINIAQRVMDCGDTGHIMVSKAAADVLGQVSTWTGALQDLGETEVKHGVRVHIFNLCLDDVGNPAIPQKLSSVSSSSQKLKSGQRSNANDAQSGPNETSDRIFSIVRPHFRTLLNVSLVIVASLFVHGAALSLFRTLSKSDPHLSAYITTGVFALVALFALTKIEQARRSGERAQKRLDNWAQTSRSAAFRNLVPYSEADGLPGTGRKRQARQLVANIKDPSFRFGVISGDVGCGKTSLLQSEVQRLLKHDGFAPILLSRAEVSDAKDVADLADAIRTAIASKQASESRVLIVDQIEEILIRFHEKEAREALGALFGEITRSDPPSKILCAIRKDYFLDLYDLESAMGVEVRPTLMLRNFTQEEAKEVIEECANLEGLSPTSDLIDSIVTDLTKEGQIRPPELQIVCTALTANFTSRHYKALGGAKGLLQSYLNIAIETCIDKEMARLILRQACDFERQAKAEPKTVDELAQAVRTQQDKLASTERLLRGVLDHLVRSRLLVVIGGGKFSLIHDYWVSIIHATTINDRSQQEKADELLHRHLHDQQAGFSSALSSKQLHLVQISANRELLGTQEAKKLIQKSLTLLWIRRGIAAVTVLTIVATGLLSSHLIWHAESLADFSGPQNARHLEDPDRLMISPAGWIKERKASSISFWLIPSGKRTSGFTVDAWEFSRSGNQLLYMDDGQAHFLDFKTKKETSIGHAFGGGTVVYMSPLAHCALYISSSKEVGVGNSGRQTRTTLQVLSLPEGKLLASTSLTRVGTYSGMPNDACDRVNLEMNYGIREVSQGKETDNLEKEVPWVWNLRERLPKQIVSRPSENLQATFGDQTVAVLEKDDRDLTQIKLWDLRNGVQRIRDLELGHYVDALLNFSDDEQFLVIQYFPTLASRMQFFEPSFYFVRTSDLEQAEFTKGQKLVNCTNPSKVWPFSEYFLWNSSKQEGFFWDFSTHGPVHLTGIPAEGTTSCSVSPDKSRMVTLRKNGSTQLWNLTENKVVDLHTGGQVISATWSLEGEHVALVRDTGQILLFDLNGSSVAILVPPGSLTASLSGDGELAISFRQTCGHILLLTADGRLLKYSKKLKIFDLPFLFPVYSRGSDSACN